jgi:hypothetical protein
VFVSLSFFYHSIFNFPLKEKNELRPAKAVEGAQTHLQPLDILQSAEIELSHLRAPRQPNAAHRMVLFVCLFVSSQRI